MIKYIVLCIFSLFFFLTLAVISGCSENTSPDSSKGHPTHCLSQSIHEAQADTYYGRRSSTVCATGHIENLQCKFQLCIGGCIYVALLSYMIPRRSAHTEPIKGICHLLSVSHVSFPQSMVCISSLFYLSYNVATLCP